MVDFERIADLTDYVAGEPLSVLIDDVPALIIELDGRYVAIEDRCSHDGQPLADGHVVQGTIECARHGARFDLTSGAALCMPATEGILTFDLVIKDGGFWGRSRKTEVATPSASGSTVIATSNQPERSEATVSNAGPVEPPDEGVLIESLREVIDPELMINIVDLGLVYGVTLTDDKVHVEMTLTSPACPAGPQIIQQSKMALMRVPGITAADIKLVMSPPWTPERMTDDARDQLGIF
jgi:metal-sulfur cluster biosynthetic enzyme/nitrite reductase/ring-hydroxylating ferredoxin subunit